MRLRLPFLTFLILLSFSLFAQKAPDFKATTTDGNAISLYEDYLNQGKSVVIEIFFVGCGPCNSLAPYMGDLHKELKAQNVAVEFISLANKNWDTEEDVIGFKTRYNHDWPFVSPEGGSLETVKVYEDGTFGAFWGTPTTIVISPDGTVNYNVRGSIGTDWTDNLKAAIIESQTAINETGPPMTTLTGKIGRTDNQGIGGVTLNFTGGKDTTIVTKADGSFETGSLLADAAYNIALSKETNPGNGVTTFDIVLITKHILGIDPFDQSAQMIAADVNLSGTITTLDIVRIRQLILGINDAFPDAPSWVFEPAELNLENLNDLSELSFTGTKIGDINNTADPADFTTSEPRNTTKDFSIAVKEQWIEKGNLYDLAFSSKDLPTTLGFQFTLDFEETALQLVDLQDTKLPKFSRNNINLNHKNQGLFSTSWDNLTPQNGEKLFTLRFKAEKSGYLSELLSVNSKLTQAEAYSHENELMEVKLIFEKDKTLPAKKANVFPNPIGEEALNLSFSLTKDELVAIQIIDLNGKIIFQQKFQLTEGDQQISIGTKDIAAGMYSVQIMQSNELIESLKFVKK